jgi:hypothetical protein
MALAVAAACLLVALGVAADLALAGLLGGAVVAAAGLVGAARSVRDSLGRLGPSDALEDFGRAVADGLSAVGAIDRSLGAGAVRVVAQSDGFYRCYLAGASAEESRRFAEALDEVLAPLWNPRYLVPRYVAEPPRSTLEALWRYLELSARQTFGVAPTGRVVYHAVPGYLAANRERAEAFRIAWNRHVSAGRPLYGQSPAAQAILAVQRGEDPFGVSSQLRTLWR